MRRCKALRGIAFAALLVSTACSDLGGFHLRASDLEIGPDPAVPGDQIECELTDLIGSRRERQHVVGAQPAAVLADAISRARAEVPAAP